MSNSVNKHFDAIGGDFVVGKLCSCFLQLCWAQIAAYGIKMLVY